MFRLLLPVLLASTRGMVMDNLKVAYQWKMLDYVYPTETERQEALQSRRFFPEHNIPTGLEVFEDRLFVAIPRLRRGVAASLAYLNISEAPSNSPKLYPYPSWEAHKIRINDPPEIVSTFKIRADLCGRLWVLDSGFIDVLEPTIKQLVKPRLLIYDLRSDQLIRSYTIPDSQMYKNESGFVNIAVEDEDCQNTFAYLADVFGPGLVVYSYKEQRSWLVKHHYFNINPVAGKMTVGGVEFMGDEGLFGLALSGADPEGYSTLFFHPITSFDEFAVSTKVLRDEDFATNSTANFHQFRRLGTRGEKGQSGASYVDKKSNVIFFASIHLNAVICWRITNTNYTTASHSRVFWNNETMVYPSDIKVDADNTLWVLSNKLPVFLHAGLDYNEYNFRILNGKVAEAIKYTACDSKMVVNKTIVEKIKGVLKKDKSEPSSSSSDYIRGIALPLLVALAFVAMSR
ncbi:protein yellow [Anoplophora glabripennis]|nr:protein yellow [Anoplophora glabripennis]